MPDEIDPLDTKYAESIYQSHFIEKDTLRAARVFALGTGLVAAFAIIDFALLINGSATSGPDLTRASAIVTTVGTFLGAFETKRFYNLAAQEVSNRQHETTLHVLRKIERALNKPQTPDGP